jgi:hypothetical protein
MKIRAEYFSQELYLKKKKGINFEIKSKTKAF